ncbi:la-related protein 7 isoform X2 [Folsomia candida]|uniref:la-related protein 7 isoform X2 n=1 Tax=Folsomia candida TaxID=158441 RepID=UPI000B8F794F|nr:la-related protein 7 isoform X2 [Folsomia candida]
MAESGVKIKVEKEDKDAVDSVKLAKKIKKEEDNCGEGVKKIKTEQGEDIVDSVKVQKTEIGDKEETGDDANTGKKKRNRKRKRQLFLDICKQMEFYFSDANIKKNRLMLEMVSAAEFVPLEKFLDFNRIKSLTEKVTDLAKALTGTSESLTVSEDGTGVKRKVPYDPKKLKSDSEMEECTIYVENVPRLVDHAWLEKNFLNFGPIAYISLPKFKSGQPKGFAFIEFMRKESAQGCLEAYQGEGSILPDDMDPGQLMSVLTFNEEQKQNQNRATSDSGKSPAKVGQQNSRKRKLDDDPSNNSDSDRTKRPKESQSVRSTVSVTTPSSEVGTDTLTNPTSSVSVVEAEMGEDADENVHGAHGEKTKKKRKKRNKLTKTPEERMEGDSIHLRVMPKRTWRQLRNRYLNLQRQNMSKLKQQLREHNLREQYYKNCQVSEEPKSKHGNIVELHMDSPAESVEAFKRQIQVDLCGQSEEEAAISQLVKYVDYEEGGLVAYVRFGEDEFFADRFLTFVHNAEKVFKWSKILTVQESLEYKARVQEALKHKKKQQPRKKERGKDRLLRAAAKSSQHIRFDGPPDVTMTSIFNSDESNDESIAA